VSLTRLVAARAEVCAGVRDPRLLAAALPLGLVAFLAFGLVAAIIPNPVFGRTVPPTDASIAIWILSGPLMGIVLATYVVRPRPVPAGAPMRLVPLAPFASAGGPAADSGEREERRSSTLGGLAGLGAFLAIGCPVCNKIVLLLLGTSGALSVWAPLQPVLGVASLALLAATAAWRLRMRANGNACEVPAGRR
jgi:hypothetical protein